MFIEAHWKCSSERFKARITEPSQKQIVMDFGLRLSPGQTAQRRVPSEAFREHSTTPIPNGDIQLSRSTD
jgi:hypothetical protein